MCIICRLQDKIMRRMFSEQELTDFRVTKSKFCKTVFTPWPVIFPAPGGTYNVQTPELATHEEVEEMIQGIRDFYRRLSPDELEILNARCTDPTPASPPKLRPHRSTPGYIYILKSDQGTRKIGRTSDPDNRLKTFKVVLPFRVEYELLIQTDNPTELERELHHRFKDVRMDGEWFDLTDEDVDMLRKEYGE